MFKFSLVTPEKKLLTDVEVDEVIVPGAKGEMDILPGHAPLVSTLATGVLKYRLKGENELKPVVLSWGYCEVYPDGVHVLANTAEMPEEIDIERAQSALKKAQERLAQAGIPTEEVLKYQRKEQRARVRLKLE